MKRRIEFKKKLIDYFLVYLLIALTGINYFATGDQFLVLGFVIVSIVFINRRLKIPINIVKLLLLFILLHVFQFIIMGSFPIYTITGFIILFLYSYFTIKIISLKFFDIYINILYFFTLISFIFFIIQFLSPGIIDYLIKFTKFTQPPFAKDSDLIDLVIYNFGAIKNSRNSGPFWEPGAFAGFLIVALMLNFLIGNKNLISDKRNMVFIIGVLTTLSTSGYLALFVFLLYNFALTRHKPLLLIILPVSLIGAFNLYSELEFMSGKISQGLLFAEEKNYGAVNRFSSIQLDLEDLSTSPFFGVTKNRDVRYGTKNETKEDKTWTHRNNGLSYYLSSYGIIGFILFFGSFLYSLYVLNKIFLPEYKSYYIVMFILILTIGFSEKYFTRPLFYSLMMLYVLKRNLSFEVNLLRLKK